jgi:hypothetical protein
MHIVESMAAGIKVLATVGFTAMLAQFSTSSFFALIHNSPRLLPKNKRAAVTGRP